MSPSDYPAPPSEELALAIRGAVDEFVISHCGRRFTELTAGDQIELIGRLESQAKQWLTRLTRERRQAINREVKREARRS